MRNITREELISWRTNPTDERTTNYVDLFRNPSYVNPVVIRFDDSQGADHYEPILLVIIFL
jgi:hypothetical protein